MTESELKSKLQKKRKPELRKFMSKAKKLDMGLSIHYNGRFNAQASLAEMIEEVKEIAEIYN